MEELLRIGEFSKMNQISIQTLRFYDKKGLLKPCQVDADSNYRYYDVKQSALVDVIKYFRQVGFSLSEIKDILSSKENLSQMIDNHRQNLLESREKIEGQLRELEHLGHSIEHYQACHSDLQPKLEEFQNLTQSAEGDEAIAQVIIESLDD